MKQKGLSHIQIIALGYFCIVILGTLLLMLPIATRLGDSAPLGTALFTSVSASCVTGLILENTVSYWSVFGQVVILGLIQLGGLGYMTVATVFYRLIIKRRGLREKVIMAESINTTRMNNFSALVKKIFWGTIIIEVLGAALLSIRFIPLFGILKGIYYSVFHSVSAFCNAGFDLLGSPTPFNSLVSFNNDPLVIFIISALIIIGGLGFLVWDDLTLKRFRFKKLNLHSKIVLTVSAVLLLLGSCLFFIFEHDKLFCDMSFSQKLLNSFFSSVTPRTAGFNSVDIASLSEASKLLTVVLMFIGGSSGSTAGGIKTTSLFVMFAYVTSSIRGKDGIYTFNKSIKNEFLNKALLVTFINLSLALCGTFIICAIEPVSISNALVETFSAISTVGLTAGVTTSLGSVSQIVIMLLMYCGRVGSVSFATALFEKKHLAPITYPAESITVG
ncbi:MAG: Trk family potassium uptake protein [Ruminococcaceae bacterium]|nr:Trk family potassium uptake protein [Oscillospiraceae bacterium]